MKYDVYIPRRSYGTCEVTIVSSHSQHNGGWNIKFVPIIVDNICKCRLRNRLGIKKQQFFLWFDTISMNICIMIYSLWNNKKKINCIIKKLKFCESFDVYMDSIE